MSSQQNSIYLSYSQDAVRRLPLAIAHELRERNHDVYLDTSHFRRFDRPPQRIFHEIESRNHFLLLLTPASLRYGFNFNENRLEAEIKHATKTEHKITVIFAYNLETTRTRSHWWMQSVLPPDLIEVVMNDTNIEVLVDTLSATLRLYDKVANSSESHTYSPTKIELDAEYILDQGLTEQYEAESDNRKSNAIGYFNRALAVDPHYAEAYFQRAECFYWPLIKNEIASEQVLADYDNAVRLNPFEARYYNKRAHLYERLGKQELALEDWTKAIQFAADESGYYENRASLYANLGDLDAALADYSKAINLKSDNARYFEQRSRIYSRKGSFTFALNDLTSAIELDPRDIYYLEKGIIHADMKDHEKAESDWIEAVRISKRPSQIYGLKANLHNRRGELDQTLYSANIALQINPNNNFAAWVKDDVLKKMRS